MQKRDYTLQNIVIVVDWVDIKFLKLGIIDEMSLLISLEYLLFTKKYNQIYFYRLFE